jgi:hypothetical protein
MSPWRYPHQIPDNLHLYTFYQNKAFSVSSGLWPKEERIRFIRISWACLARLEQTVFRAAYGIFFLNTL